jgi:hypothetical protein
MARSELGEAMARKTRTHLRFRIEPELQKQLEKARKESGRTLTAEITERLKKSFSDEVSAGLKDLREELIRFRAGMMDEIRRELDNLRLDIAQRKDEPQ